MRNVLLRSIYILLILRTLVAVGFPTNTEADDKTSLEKNSIIGDVAKNDAYASVESYMCIHIPPELKNCNFPRLPFILPWCTKEDLAAKENEIYRLTPFVRKNTSTTSLEHPDYDV
ncbi:hypothetical protein EAI_01326 [Harpegnathos saltator]|uniref:Uncharacterized protein n=1 Tax=Harpegnathos saltator TaxID=610380 RepID=E2BBF4_HARSA|nr:hypothetical protein EAI_01326 [Harpegnathos saltator]